jgi:hypothetical protein
MIADYLYARTSLNLSVIRSMLVAIKLRAMRKDSLKVIESRQARDSARAAKSDISDGYVMTESAYCAKYGVANR